MRQVHFVLTAVEACRTRLCLSYADGQTFEVDLSERIFTTVFLAPLRDATLFAPGQAGICGTVGGLDRGWKLDLGTDNLRRTLRSSRRAASDMSASGPGCTTWG